MKLKSYIRFWEIDFFRGIAVIMMIIFHFLYDLNYFGIYKINLNSSYFQIYIYSGATFFILLVGVSLSLNYTRLKNEKTGKELLFKYLMRGLKIFVLGLFITLISWIYLDEGFVIFGALHCIGISIMLAYSFLNFRYLNLLFGIILIILGIILRNMTFDFSWLVWLGFMPSTFYTIDYFPLLPWFGVVLIGIFLGNILYPDNKRVFNLKNFHKLKAIRYICFLGQHSLIIYFIHQPIMLTIIYLIFML